MKHSVKNLAETSGYSLDYFFKLLRKSNISNRILVDKFDLVKLKNDIDIVNHKSYVLYNHIDMLLKETK